MRKYNTNKKFIKNLIIISSLSISSVAAISAAVSCSISTILKVTNESPDNLDLIKSYEFENISNEFNIENNNLNLFKEKNTQEIYVNINEFITKLKGLFLENVFKYSENTPLGHKFTVFGREIIFDDVNNKILFKSTGVFSFLKSSSTKDYSNKIEYLEDSIKSLNEGEYTELDLQKYNFSIFEKNKNIFLPFSVFNLLFLSQSYYNIYFNGDKLIGITSTINKDIDASEYNKVMNNSYNNAQQTEQQRLNNYNFLLFLFDNFYGLEKTFLKKHKVNSLDEFFTKTDLKEKLMSPDATTNANGYEEFVYKYLNELHTSIQSGSYFHPKNYRANPYASAESSRIQSYVETYRILSRIRNAKNLQNNLNNDNDINIVSFHNDIAIIYLNSFTIGTNEEINGKQPYKYDSYFLMFEAMKRIQEHSKTQPINKIILDLSLNGGGSIAAMEKVVAFMTNKDQKIYFYDVLNKLLNFTKYRVDVNGDNFYNARDGYTNYNWYILVGKNTFSAANLLTHIAKLGNFATIIGNTSGGGMYSILPVVLPDGTSLDISSNNAWIGVPDEIITNENDLPYTEEGIEVDLEIPYFAYYEYDIIEAYLKDPALGEKKYSQYLTSIKQKAWDKVYNDIQKYLLHIKDKRKKKEYTNKLQEYAIHENDSLEKQQEKIEQMESLFRLVEFQYEHEMKQRN
ncbi:S41 family peptidase [Mycoplasma zalophi]|uniref:S41 family peptidase n=1 Tax=Mycoplasma zalophi TaxID=191287 RepID=UPI0021C5EAC2|nr:S41 family peptidase [Mycoplasma zalophi]MCU4117047.1 S41 family peptidase [Mycoplasma zalophi]